MKLLFCPKCGDVFNLRIGKIKSCDCGNVRGKYLDQRNAVVNGQGFSLAMGTGSLVSACHNVSHDPNERRPKEREVICWTRQHSGPSNPHTVVDETIGIVPTKEETHEETRPLRKRNG